MQVYHMVPAFKSRVPRVRTLHTSTPSRFIPKTSTILGRTLSFAVNHVKHVSQNLLEYTQHPVFLPSMALSLLYLTVLSFTGQMVTYILSVGLTSTTIGLLRTASTAIEISATWLAPITMKRVGPMRAGLWSITWQLGCTLAAVSSIWVLTEPRLAAFSLIAFVIASRVGLWGFDLCVQHIVQGVILYK